MEAKSEKMKSTDIFSDEEIDKQPLPKEDERFKKQHSYTYWV